MSGPLHLQIDLSKGSLKCKEVIDTVGKPIGIHLLRNVLTVDVLAGGRVKLHPTERINLVRAREKMLIMVRAVGLGTNLLK